MDAFGEIFKREMDIYNEIIKRELVMSNINIYLKELLKLRDNNQVKIDKIKENILKSEQKLEDYEKKQQNKEEYIKNLKEYKKQKRFYMLFLPFISPAFFLIFGLLTSNLTLALILGILGYLILLLIGSVISSKDTEHIRTKLTNTKTSVENDAEYKDLERDISLKKSALVEYENELNEILEQIKFTNDIMESLRIEIFNIITRKISITPELELAINETNNKIHDELMGKSRIRNRKKV